MKKSISLKFKSLPEVSSDVSDVVYFMESGFDPVVNDAIVKHLDEIKEMFMREDMMFVYFPTLLHDMQEAVEYNYPNLDSMDLKASASSDALLSLLVKEQSGMCVPPCVGRCVDSEDDVDIVQAYPVSIDKEDELMPLMRMLKDKILYGEDYDADEHGSDGALYSEYESLEDYCALNFQPPADELPIQEGTADESFDDDVRLLMQDVYSRVMDLKLQGVSEWTLKRYLFPEKKLSRLVITDKYDVVLPDYHNRVIKMEPLVKAIFILFLRHEEGIVFKSLPDYRDELYDIYKDIRASMDKPVQMSEERIQQSILSVTNPLSNSINEKCARVRAAFVSQFDESISSAYYIDGKRGEVKRISLDRSLVDWKRE